MALNLRGIQRRTLVDWNWKAINQDQVCPWHAARFSSEGVEISNAKSALITDVVLG